MRSDRVAVWANRARFGIADRLAAWIGEFQALALKMAY